MLGDFLMGDEDVLGHGHEHCGGRFSFFFFSHL